MVFSRRTAGAAQQAPTTIPIVMAGVRTRGHRPQSQGWPVRCRRHRLPSHQTGLGKLIGILLEALPGRPAPRRPVGSDQSVEGVGWAAPRLLRRVGPRGAAPSPSAGASPCRPRTGGSARARAFVAVPDAMFFADRAHLGSLAEDIGWRRGIRCASTSRIGGLSLWLPTSRDLPRRGSRTWTRSSRARNPPICRSSSRRGSSWSSTRRPPRRSGSRSRNRCCCARTR